MLKGFVSGEEKDIVRIPMKGWNLLDESASSDADATHINYNKGTPVVLTAGQTYTFSCNTACNGLYIRSSADDSNLASANNSSTLTYTPQANVSAYFRIWNNNGITNLNPMFNLGSTPLPYEPYGYQEGWEVRDSQDRLIWGREDELQTATGTLPFKGYALPVKVKSLLGNAVQNGTPAPSPVNPNLVDPSATVPGYQESDGNIHTPSSGNERTTDWIPFTTSALYAIVSGSNSGNINWVLYDSSKQPLYFQGPTFTPNTVIIISRESYSTAAYVRISWTNAANQPICVTTEQRSEYIAFDPNPPGPVIPEMCGVRTGNLLNSAIIENGKGVDTSGNVVSYETRIATVQPIDITEIDSAVLSYSSTNPIMFIYAVLNNGTLVRRTAGKTTGAALDLQGGNELYLCWYYTGTVTKSDISNIMLNSGSTALPYEPYGEWKIPFENHGENLFYSDRTNQNTTASSTIDQTEGSSELVISKNETSSAVALSVTINLPLRAGTYTVSIDGLSIIEGNLDRINLRDSNGVIVNNVMTGSPQTFTIAADTVVNAVVFVCASTSTYTNKKVRIMLNPGSTPKPYSPYLNATIPVYLGEVPTVRRVKKLVLDGTETFVATTASTHYRCRTTLVPKATTQSTIAVLSTHYYASAGARDGTITLTSDGGSVYFTDDTNAVTAETFKAYLASEYAAGHPVTIWYVLDTPETTISNEPLCKISTYADELTTIQAHGLSAPLYGIGDYKDTLNLSTGVVTRKVKKAVFDGTEGWAKAGSSTSTFYYFSVPTPLQNSTAICTHFELAMFSSSSYIRIYDGGKFQDVDAFKSYLAAQYQAGTPVTVWYVLNTPETETVTVPTGMTGEIEGYLTQVSTPTPTNRSVPKWNGVEETGGTYAVTVYTPPEIPTTTGQNTLTVETEKIHGLTSPLCGIGDYKDVLNLSTGVITRKIKKITLTGSETYYTDWRPFSGTYGCLVFATTDSPVGINNQSVYCTHLASESYNSVYNGTVGVATVGGANYSVALRVPDTVAQDSTEFSTWVANQYSAGTPVEIWYVLATPETETITIPYGLECSVEGYLTQSGTPTPSSPITPDSNGILESGGTYAVEVSLVPSNLTVKGHIKELT